MMHIDSYLKLMATTENERLKTIPKDSLFDKYVEFKKKNQLSNTEDLKRFVSFLDINNGNNFIKELAENQKIKNIEDQLKAYHDKNYSIGIYVNEFELSPAVNFNRLFIYYNIHYPLITITNDKNETHTIREVNVLFCQLGEINNVILDYDKIGILPNQLLVNRTKYNLSEFYSRYSHSHVSSHNNSASFLYTYRRFCIGDGSLSKAMTNFNNNTEGSISLLILEIEAALSYESFKGRPYQFFSNLLSNIYVKKNGCKKTAEDYFVEIIRNLNFSNLPKDLLYMTNKDLTVSDPKLLIQYLYNYNLTHNIVEKDFWKPKKKQSKTEIDPSFIRFYETCTKPDYLYKDSLIIDVDLSNITPEKENEDVIFNLSEYDLNLICNWFIAKVKSLLFLNNLLKTKTKWKNLEKSLMETSTLMSVQG